MVPFNKWKVKKPNLTVKSIILIKYDKNSESEFRMAKLILTNWSEQLVGMGPRNKNKKSLPYYCNLHQSL